jgi:hypothetical protein
MDKWKIALMLFSLLYFIFLTPFTLATTDETGGTTGQDQFVGYPYASPITTSASGTLSTIGVNIQAGGTGNVRLAIYSNLVAVPNNLLCESGSTALSGTGWTDVDVSACSLSIASSTAYWLAIQQDATGDKVYISSASAYQATQVYGAFASIWVGTAGAERPNMRMTYAGAAINNILDNLTCSPNPAIEIEKVLCNCSKTDHSSDADVDYNLWWYDVSLLNTSTGADVWANDTWSAGSYTVLCNSTEGENYTANDTGLNISLIVSETTTTTTTTSTTTTTETTSTTTTTTPSIPACTGTEVADCFTILNETTCVDYYSYDAYYSQCEWHEANGDPAGCYISGIECSVIVPPTPAVYSYTAIGFSMFILGLAVWAFYGNVGKK